jgi:MFS family permease
LVYDPISQKTCDVGVSQFQSDLVTIFNPVLNVVIAVLLCPYVEVWGNENTIKLCGPIVTISLLCFFLTTRVCSPDISTLANFTLMTFLGTASNLNSTAAFSQVIKNTTHDKRDQVIGLMRTLIAVGVIFGPLLGGLLKEKFEI